MLGNCGGCGLERELDAATLRCAMCARRGAAEVRVNGHGGKKPEPEPGRPHVVGELIVRMWSDGNVQVTGPLHDRRQIVELAVAAMDLSLDEERRRAKEAAALANPPKKFSRGWWAQKFEESRRRREAEGLAQKQKELEGREASGESETRH